MRKVAVMARAFLKSSRANVAMMFALSLMPLMIGAGAGLDYARAMLVRQQMGEALDAAALAVGSTSGLTRDSAQARAQKYFDANYTVNKTEYGAPVINTPSSGYDSKGSVTITAIDDHEKATCDAAKADGVVIYTIFLDIGGTHGNSAPLRYCATDATKYYDLTTTSAVVGTFKQIAQQITNVRVVK